MSQDPYSLITHSDKSFWHGYMDFYASHLPGKIDGLIIEFGVFKGNSTKWLLQAYPQARIIGVDILPVQPEWPQGDRVEYRELDQGREEQIRSFFEEIPPPTLIIEDGSHIPSHQSRCLKHGINKLKPGGIYILEDIHTSHPAHPLFQEEFNTQKAPRGISGVFRSHRKIMKGKQTSLSLLLALEQIKRTGRSVLSEGERSILSRGTHFTKADVRQLNSQIKSIHVYRRATLPAACYACGSTTFDYHDFKCTCGVDLLNEADSMSILIVKNGE